MGKVEAAEDQPISERDEFLKDKLGSTKIRDSAGNEITFKESLGKEYPAYERLVLERVEYTDSLPTKRLPRKEFESRFRENAKRIGFSGAALTSIRLRSDHLYQEWLNHKHTNQREQEVFRVYGGKDPNMFLGDGSHRKQSGYIN